MESAVTQNAMGLVGGVVSLLYLDVLDVPFIPELFLIFSSSSYFTLD